MLEKVTFYDYYKNFTVESPKKKNNLPKYRDIFGHYIYESTRLIHFTDYHPSHHLEPYFFVKI